MEAAVSSISADRTSSGEVMSVFKTRLSSLLGMAEKALIMQKSKGKANAISRHTKKLPYSVPRVYIANNKNNVGSIGDVC